MLNWLRKTEKKEGEKGREVGEVEGRTFKWCFSHHCGGRWNWHHDGSRGKHKLWVTFSDSSHSTMVMCLPTSWEEDVLFLKGQGFLAFAAVGNCTQGKVPGQNLWHFGAPLCPIWHQHELHQVYAEREWEFFPEECRVGSGSIDMLCFHMYEEPIAAWVRREIPMPLFVTALWMLSPECPGWDLPWDKPEQLVM